MTIPDRLAFVDVETTGLRPGVDRIAEVAVVTLEGGVVSRWSTVVDAFASGHASTSWRTRAPEWADAPRFAAIAPALAARLQGYLLVAHNARFDHAFLQAEFDFARIPFNPQVVCSVMLSRRLWPELARHDLDSLAEVHRLPVTVRHRALPDAELLRAWWCEVVLRMPMPVVSHAVRSLLAGPLLPATLDPAVVSALPASPGAFAMLDSDDAVLHTGASANVRAHVTQYFRIGHASGRALRLAHRVHRIDWRTTRGVLGARLHALNWAATPATVAEFVTWRIAPDAIPCVTLAPCGEGQETFGCFDSPRKARLALSRLAWRDGLCRCLLGDVSPGTAPGPATHCCGASLDRVARVRAMLRIFAALRSLRIAPWPHQGPIALREGNDLILIDRWRFLGTAKVAADIHDLLATTPPHFNPRAYRLLVRAVRRSAPGNTMLLRQPHSVSD